MRTPDPDHPVTVALVEELLGEQFPDLSSQPVSWLAEGWDNVLFALGDDLVVRLPRRAMASRHALHEHRFLPSLAARLPLAIPAPLRLGRPGRGYPWHWTVVPRLTGAPLCATGGQLTSVDDAERLGAFLAVLHVPAPADAPENPWRGVPLASRDASITERIAALPADLAGRAATAWGEALLAPVHEGPALWLHGDLHAGNVLVESGHLSGILDFGDLTSGDPATDLAAAWLLLADAALAERALTAYGGVDDALRARAIGWAVGFGALLATIEDDATPGLRRSGLDALRRMLR